MRRRLPLDFYLQDTVSVAKALLGKHLVHIVETPGRKKLRLAGRIVETEAYVGREDKACHAYGDRRTTRTESLYMQGGFSYVFLIYGMHCCFNVVTHAEGEPEAVLIRAVEPMEGLEEMKRRRQLKKPTLINLTNGPGKLCEALGIDRSCDRLSLTKSKSLFIEVAPDVKPTQIVATPRIGVDYAEEAAEWPLRFVLRDHPFASKM